MVLLKPTSARNVTFLHTAILQLQAQAGCHLAFQRFGEGLIKADIYLTSREFPQEHWKHTGKIEFLDQMNPRLLSNNLLLPYLVSVLEDYFKSTFVVLLQYSDRKESFLRGARLSSDHFLRICLVNLLSRQQLQRLFHSSGTEPFVSISKPLSLIWTLQALFVSHIVGERSRYLKRWKRWFSEDTHLSIREG